MTTLKFKLNDTLHKELLNACREINADPNTLPFMREQDFVRECVESVLASRRLSRRAA